MRRFISVLACIALLTSFAVFANANPSTYVTYAQFGAVGDGVTCDFDAIIAAHNYANANNLPVRAEPGAVYYIIGCGSVATIQTNTDWRGAQFIIDDTAITYDNGAYVLFQVTSRYATTRIESIEALYAGQANIGITLPQQSFVIIRDYTTRHYMHPGMPNGEAKTDLIIVCELGYVDSATPIIWDFNHVNYLEVFPMDEEVLTVSGGNFTTIANQTPQGQRSYNRGINITRSNVVLDDVHHQYTGEEYDGAIYMSFFRAQNAANITIQNSTMSVRRNTRNLGSYALFAFNVANFTVRNVQQFNCIHDRNYWGAVGIHIMKNMVFDNVALSRIGSHRRAHNLTIRNSEVGWTGIPTTGSGTLLLENTTVSSWHLITLRELFGSSWRGDIVIRDVVFRPQSRDVALIYFANNGQNNFGFQAALPTTICIDGLVIDDAHMRWNGRPFPHIYTGPTIFTANHTYGNDALGILLLWDWLTVRRRAPHRIQITQEISLRNVEVTSGRRLRLSRSVFEFRNTNLTWRCPCAS